MMEGTFPQTWQISFPSVMRISIPPVKMIQFSRNRREGESCQLTMPDNRYWTVGAFVGNAWEAGKGLKQG